MKCHSKWLMKDANSQRVLVNFQYSSSSPARDHSTVWHWHIKCHWQHLTNIKAQLFFKVHHCSDQLRTIVISWQGGQAAKSSSCLWFPRTWRSGCSSRAPPWTSPRLRAPSTGGGKHWGSSGTLHPGSSACESWSCSLGRISLIWRLLSKHQIQSRPEIFILRWI